jgi:hypothetical protein
MDAIRPFAFKPNSGWMRSLSDFLYNFHWIEPAKAARSSQAYAGFLGAFLKARGIRAVVNLRGSNLGYWWWRYETRVCARLGVVHRDAKLSSRQLPTREMLIDVLDAIAAVPRPFLLKCSGGQDRTSLAAALYILDARGWSARDEAQAQFAGWPYLHWPKGHQRWLKLLPLFAQERAQGRTLRSWVENGYSANSFREWLEAHGEGASFRALYDVPGSSSGR